MDRCSYVDGTINYLAFEISDILELCLMTVDAFCFPCSFTSTALVPLATVGRDTTMLFYDSSSWWLAVFQLVVETAVPATRILDPRKFTAMFASTFLAFTYC